MYVSRLSAVSTKEAGQQVTPRLRRESFHRWVACAAFCDCRSTEPALKTQAASAFLKPAPAFQGAASSFLPGSRRPDDPVGKAQQPTVAHNLHLRLLGKCPAVLSPAPPASSQTVAFLGLLLPCLHVGEQDRRGGGLGRTAGRLLGGLPGGGECLSEG